MFVLPSAFAAMRTYRQFILYQLVPSASRPGKTDKHPLNYSTGLRHDAHDPKIWLTCEEAAGFAEAFGPGYGVGFVFTPQDPFFFIDIDECSVEGGNGWSDTANALMSRLAGGAVEISVSGRGLHIFGTLSALPPPPPARKVKYGQFFDLYTENRFVALTGAGAVGDAGTNHDAAISQLIADYLMPDPAGEVVGWTTAPVEGWRGNTDDNQLIQRMYRSKSAPQALGHRVCFDELFEANADRLAHFFPDPHRDEGFDASAADSALAQTLAFWTGNDCERIRRIMLMSALKRAKWDREDYLPRTILAVVARQHDVLKDAAPEPATMPTLAGATVAGVAEAKAVTGETFLSYDAQMAMFKGCVYVQSKHRVLVPGGHLLKPDQFKVMFGGYTFPMDMENSRIVRNAYEAFTESQCFRSPRAEGVTFRPDRPPSEIVVENGQTLVNVWWPIQTECTPGDPGPFLRHFAKLLPNEEDRKKLLSYMAAVVQYPGVKFQWAPLIQGVEGNGKTFLMTCVERAVGDKYSHKPNSQDLNNRFTGWLEQKLFIAIEEIYSQDRRELMETLKPLITNSRVEIQAKGMDQVTGDNRANFMACTNHKDAIPKTANDRRWAIFFTAQQEFEDLARDGMDGGYMPELWNWAENGGFAIINHFLRGFAIPTELNPAGASHRAPDTSSTREAITLSVGAVEQEILEAVESEQVGFAGGWVSSLMLDRMLKQIGADRRISPRKRHEILKGLGYDWHPTLRESGGRVSHSIQPDGGKPRLFSLKGHLINSISSASMAVKTYTDAQMKAATAKADFGVDGIGNKG